MLHVVHHPDYVIDADDGTHSFAKYALVIEALRADGLPLLLHAPVAMPRNWIEAAHDPDYVAAVLGARVDPAIERRIGFAVTPDVARRAVMTPGGTWRAAKLAQLHGFAANAAGGSHHALPDTGAGYCVFNDLAITALRLLGEGDARRILIVDGDVHQGDGTAVILAGRSDVATLSVHAEKNFPARKARSTWDVALPDATGDADYAAAFETALRIALDDMRPDLVLFQAGVDPHVDDKLGRLSLSDAGLQMRDFMIAGAARARGIPLASAMGGGYGKDGVAVAARHAATMRNLAHGYFD